jgi:hypothetical protein
MDLFARDDLTDEERERLEQNSQEARMERMDEIVDGYYAAATDDERTRYLDRQIDEFIEFRDEMQRWQEENPEEWQKMQERWRERYSRAPTREERKEAFETGTMEKRMRMWKYFMAARERGQQRGLDMTPPWAGNRDSDMDDESAQESEAGDDERPRRRRTRDDESRRSRRSNS